MNDAASAPLVLALTVGGSREPLDTAIRTTNPDILLLIASASEARSKSSLEVANALKTDFERSREGREAKMIEVAADDPDRAFARIVADIDAFRKKHRDCRIVADYTGGTKSMSAALLMAAFQRDLKTQITTGRRDDLSRVTAGTERARDVDARLIGVERDFALALRVASYGDYAAASGLIKSLREKVERERLTPPKSLGARLQHGYDWSESLAAWDRFDHKTACRKFKAALDVGAPWAEALEASGHAAILADLAQGADAPRLSLCQDLLENARRRKRQGRHDDALARLYRFVEACVQTQLYRRYRLKSDALAKSDLPPALQGRLQPRGEPPKYQTALRQTVDVLRHKDPKDPVAAAYFSDDDLGPAWLSRRNKSILAHGYSAVGAQVVEEAFAWIDEKMIPALGMTPMPPFPDKPEFG